MWKHRPLPPVALSKVLDAPELVRELLEQDAPYAPVQRYFANEGQQELMSGPKDMLIAPNFRGDWAYDEPLVPGVEPFLYHEGFVKAAEEIFGPGSIVRPRIVYANVTWQLPFRQGTGHTDVPEFRGIARTRYPVWFLSAMGYSRLFEEHRVNIATSVSWFYHGTDGGLTFWPEGWDGPRKVHEGAIWNTALVGDNDFMPHHVNPVGPREKGLPQGMSLESRLCHVGGDDWQIRDGDDVLGAPKFDELRVSVSWKAHVFQSDREARRFDSHEDDLSFEEVHDRLVEDLARRGRPYAGRSATPLEDPAFSAALEVYFPKSPG